MAPKVYLKLICVCVCFKALSVWRGSNQRATFWHFQGRSRSLTHIDNLDPAMILRAEDMDSKSEPDTSHDQLLYVPNAGTGSSESRDARRKKLTRSQVTDLGMAWPFFCHASSSCRLTWQVFKELGFQSFHNPSSNSITLQHRSMWAYINLIPNVCFCSQVSSNEFYSVSFEGELGAGIEEFLPVTHGTSLR